MIIVDVYFPLVYLFILNLIVRGKGFKHWMSPLKILWDTSWAIKLLSSLIITYLINKLWKIVYKLWK